MPKNTVLHKITAAIRSQPPSGSKGVSRVVIQKYLKQEESYDNASALKRALKKGVDSGVLIQTGQSFRVVGDKVEEDPDEPKVESSDVKEGSGRAATKGDTVVVKYEGKLQDGTVFDSANSFTFTLGDGDVIKGWDIGIVGMKVGGKRTLEVPSKLGYGKRGSAPDIPPNADLSFTVTLKKIM